MINANDFLHAFDDYTWHLEVTGSGWQHEAHEHLRTRVPCRTKIFWKKTTWEPFTVQAKADGRMK